MLPFLCQSTLTLLHHSLTLIKKTFRSIEGWHNDFAPASEAITRNLLLTTVLRENIGDPKARMVATINSSLLPAEYKPAREPEEEDSERTEQKETVSAFIGVLRFVPFAGEMGKRIKTLLLLLGRLRTGVTATNFTTFHFWYLCDVFLTSTAPHHLATDETQNFGIRKLNDAQLRKHHEQ